MTKCMGNTFYIYNLPLFTKVVNFCNINVNGSAYENTPTSRYCRHTQKAL